MTSYPEEAREICRGALEARGEDWLADEEMRRVLNAFRLPLVASAVAHTAEDAAASAALIGFPVVAKIRSHKIQHKTDIGGVCLNLQNADAVKAAFDEIMACAKKADDVPEIVELDLNPVIALPDGHGCRIVDARIKVGAVGPALTHAIRRHEVASRRGDNVGVPHL